MRVAYIGLYTLTDAQRARELLERRSIRARVARMPTERGVGCAFGLKLQERDVETARRLLEGGRLRLGKTVYRHEEAGRDDDLL